MNRRTPNIRRLRNRRMPDKSPPRAWAAAWKRLAKVYRIDLRKSREYNLAWAEAFAYLESRISDYPILEVLLKQAREK